MLLKLYFTCISSNNRFEVLDLSLSTKEGPSFVLSKAFQGFIFPFLFLYVGRGFLRSFSLLELELSGSGGLLLTVCLGVFIISWFSLLSLGFCGVSLRKDLWSGGAPVPLEAFPESAFL